MIGASDSEPPAPDTIQTCYSGAHPMKHGMRDHVALKQRVLNCTTDCRDTVPFGMRKRKGEEPSGDVTGGRRGG
jgi:hypothetical protein